MMVLNNPVNEALFLGKMALGGLPLDSSHFGKEFRWSYPPWNYIAPENRPSQKETSIPTIHL